jgi:hypothetical protein
MGKTVLVKQISERLAARGWLSGYFETRRDVGPGAAIEAVVAPGVILLPTASRVRKALAKLIKAAPPRGPSSLLLSATLVDHR